MKTKIYSIVKVMNSSGKAVSYYKLTKDGIDIPGLSYSTYQGANLKLKELEKSL